MSLNEYKIGVIGVGFVGSAVCKGFSSDTKRPTEVYKCDPKKLGSESIPISDMARFVDVMFLCLPTPTEKDGYDMEPSFLRNALSEIAETRYDGLVVIKSTVTPKHLRKMCDDHSNLRIVYNPEFLTERTAEQDFQNPFFQIIGGDSMEDCEELEKIYQYHSNVKKSPVYAVDLETASLIKYVLNTYYATKVMFMNEMYQLHQESGASTTWDEFRKILDTDPRMGPSHLMVPGPDGEFGFGGNCFPKDTKALLHYADEIGVSLGILARAVFKNQRIRGL
tara:strand:- start:2 stop:838 length:837 start_codon:yes stop_codon:yes gene_type:complete